MKLDARRGVLILPSLFTLGNLFCGLYAIRLAADARYEGAPALEKAAFFIVVAILLDGLDGKVARIVDATTALGVQLDSLADIVSFGVAPGLLLYSWALADLPRIGWPVAGVFTCCGAIRLARFNVLADSGADNRYFVGLPIPAAAGSVAAAVLLWPSRIQVPALNVVIAVASLTLALLMVSTLRYRSFKQVELKKRRPFSTLLWVILIFSVVGSNPQAALAASGLLYTLSAPFSHGVKLLKRRFGREPLGRQGDPAVATDDVS